MTIVTLEQVEQLAAKLPPQEQLKLVSRISDRLTITIAQFADDDKETDAYFEQMDRFIMICEDSPIEPSHEVDSAATIRQNRLERQGRI